MPERAEHESVRMQPASLTTGTACAKSVLIATGEQGRGRAYAHKLAVAAELRRQSGTSAAVGLVGTVSVQRQYPRGHQAVCTCNRIATRRRLLRGFAVADAYHHASQTGCVPAKPLFPPRITTA